MSSVGSVNRRLSHLCAHLTGAPSIQLAGENALRPFFTKAEQEVSAGPSSSASADARRKKKNKFYEHDEQLDTTRGQTKEDASCLTEEIEMRVEFDEAKQKYELAPVPHTVSYDQGFFYATRAIELLREKQPDKVICVGVAGPPGAGKTTLAKQIAGVLGEALVIPLESFVKVDKVIDANYDDISLVEFTLVETALKELKEGKTTQIPQVTVFSQENRKRTGFNTVRVPKSQIVILEGSYALNPSINYLHDVTIAITGGVHLDLIKHIFRDTVTSRAANKDALVQITHVMFPMYKAFIEPDLKNAMIRIHSTYNPMEAMVDPSYSCKANFKDLEGDEEAIKNKLKGRFRQEPLNVKRTISDMYLYPPKYNRDSVYQADRSNWIRIRRMDGLFFINFYAEVMDATLNVRPTVDFEISVKTISGLLSLGYQIGAILNRTSEVWFKANGLMVTKEEMKELGKTYIQIKGKKRGDVIALAKVLGMDEHHIPQSFLQLYFRQLQKRKKGSLQRGTTTTMQQTQQDEEETMTS
ncbi:Adenylate cyclase domain-containing protein [Balamuthia mandrillaris]